MSVKNQYARNYYKIAPMPQTASDMEDARNAVRRRNMYRHSIDYETETIKSEYRMNNFTNMKGVRRHSEQNATSQPKKQPGTRKFNFSKTHGQYDFKQDTVKTPNDQMTMKGRVTQVVPRREPDSRTDSGSSKTSTTKSVVDDHFDKRQLRPKSARPESRWQRRTGDDDKEDILPDFSGSDTDSDSEVFLNNQERPMSARPDSRLVRMLEGQQGSSSKADHPPMRPTTSHGRRQSKTVKSKEEEHIQRPKSRIGNRDGWKFEPNEKWKRKETTLQNDGTKKEETKYHSKIPVVRKSNKQSDENRLMSTNEHMHGQSNEGITPRDIFFGIDEIDLDVDPVEYFNSPGDDTQFVSGYNNKPSLSKSAIKFISNEKSSHQKNLASGFPGNNQNKRSINSEISDRNYGNKVLSQKNIIADPSITGTSSRQTRNTSDSIKPSNFYRNHVPTRDDRLTNLGSRVVSLGTGEKVHMGFPVKGRKVDLAIDKRQNPVQSRQPRKLQPLAHGQNRE